MLKYTPRTKTSFIAVHCSATSSTMDIGEEEIRRWHQDKGWLDVGYNIVIRRSGVVEIGRPLDYQGAHVAGYNHITLGICVVGGTDYTGRSEDNFTDEQRESLLTTLKFCKLYAPDAKIQGHRDFPNVAKDCPSFDVRRWLEEVAPQLLT